MHGLVHTCRGTCQSMASGNVPGQPITRSISDGAARKLRSGLSIPDAREHPLYLDNYLVKGKIHLCMPACSHADFDFTWLHNYSACLTVRRRMYVCSVYLCLGFHMYPTWPRDHDCETSATQHACNIALYLQLHPRPAAAHQLLSKG